MDLFFRHRSLDPFPHNNCRGFLHDMLQLVPQKDDSNEWRATQDLVSHDISHQTLEAVTPKSKRRLLLALSRKVATKHQQIRDRLVYTFSLEIRIVQAIEKLRERMASRRRPGMNAPSPLLVEQPMAQQ